MRHKLPDPKTQPTLLELVEAFIDPLLDDHYWPRRMQFAADLVATFRDYGFSIVRKEQPSQEDGKPTKP